MKMIAEVLADSDIVKVTFSSDDASQTVEMTKEEFIKHVGGK